MSFFVKSRYLRRKERLILGERRYVFASCFCTTVPTAKLTKSIDFIVCLHPRWSGPCGAEELYIGIQLKGLLREWYLVLIIFLCERELLQRSIVIDVVVCVRPCREIGTTDWYATQGVLASCFRIVVRPTNNEIRLTALCIFGLKQVHC